MDRRNMVWPINGTGAQLAETLRSAANGATSMSGGATEVIDGYLGWAADQIRMLQGMLSSSDLDRLITTPRYWATQADRTTVLTTVNVITDELQHRRRVLEATADAVSQQAEAWSPSDGQFTNYVLVDTNFWMEKTSSDLDALDWHQASPRRSRRA